MPQRRPSAREALTLAKALVRGGERREAAVARILRPDNLFQPYTTTTEDRYPEEFARIAAALDRPALAVLSFGCSSGAELLALGRAFPGARIRGIDINPLAVRNARRRVREAGLARRVSIGRGGDASAEPAAAYDVVTALAVFRHGSLKAQPPTCTELLRFADFDRTVAGLSAALRPGGLLLIRHANFRFTDTSVAADYELVVRFESEGTVEGTPVYGPDERLLGAANDDGLYRRLR